MLWVYYFPAIALLKKFSAQNFFSQFDFKYLSENVGELFCISRWSFAERNFSVKSNTFNDLPKYA